MQCRISYFALAVYSMLTGLSQAEDKTQNIKVAKPISTTDGVEVGMYRALLIGVDIYRDAETWSRLKTPVNDVKALHSVLTTNYRFKPENTTLLSNEQATLQNVKAALFELRRKSQKEDHVLVYYAGHGDYERKSGEKKAGGCWILHDGEGRHCESAQLDARDLITQLSKVEAKHMLVISDACFSDTPMRGRQQDTNPTPTQYTKNLRHSASLVLTSGVQNRTVSEQDTSGHSPFAQAVLQRLNSPKSEIGFVSATELVDAVRQHDAEHKLRNARLKGLPERSDNGGDFVFVPKWYRAKTLTDPIIKTAPSYGTLTVVNWHGKPIKIVDDSNHLVAARADEKSMAVERSTIGVGESKTYRLQTQTVSLQALDTSTGAPMASIEAMITGEIESTWDVGSIEKTAPNTYVIKAKAWVSWLRDLNRLTRQARVMRYYQHEKQIGFKLLAVHRTGIWRQLGLRSGDILKTVGGVALTDIESAKKIVENLKTATEFIVELERRRNTRTFTYRVR